MIIKNHGNKIPSCYFRPVLEKNFQYVILVIFTVIVEIVYPKLLYAPTA